MHFTVWSLFYNYISYFDHKRFSAVVLRKVLPMFLVAIVSGVIGTLTFILIVLLIILVYRWWQDRRDATYKRKSQDVEYLDARNPAYRSSTGTEFGGIEIYYNC